MRLSRLSFLPHHVHQSSVSVAIARTGRRYVSGQAGGGGATANSASAVTALYVPISRTTKTTATKMTTTNALKVHRRSGKWIDGNIERGRVSSGDGSLEPSVACGGLQQKQKKKKEGKRGEKGEGEGVQQQVGNGKEASKTRSAQATGIVAGSGEGTFKHGKHCWTTLPSSVLGDTFKLLQAYCHSAQDLSKNSYLVHPYEPGRAAQFLARCRACEGMYQIAVTQSIIGGGSRGNRDSAGLYMSSSKPGRRCHKGEFLLLPSSPPFPFPRPPLPTGF